MALPTLDSLTDMLDEKTVELLGDPITYTPAGGTARALMVWGDQGERNQAGGGIGVIVGEKVIEVRMADAPVRPGPGVIVEFADGSRYEPREVRSDESGRWWIVGLKAKRA